MRGNAAIATIILVCVAVVHGDSKPAREYEVKAGFLFHFVQFVEWPDSAFPGREAPLSIGVIGNDPFGSTLDQIVQGETVHNRKLAIKRSNNIEELKGCQVLFIGKAEKEQIPNILQAMGNAPILAVGETEGFATHGGAINFYIAENKIRFEINPDAARDRGLKISSRLLSLGTVVH